jgi:hypothetical protein
MYLHKIHKRKNTFLTKLTPTERWKNYWLLYVIPLSVATCLLPIILCRLQKHLLTRFVHKDTSLRTEYSPPKKVTVSYTIVILT